MRNNYVVLFALFICFSSGTAFFNGESTEESGPASDVQVEEHENIDPECVSMPVATKLSEEQAEMLYLEETYGKLQDGDWIFLEDELLGVDYLAKASFVPAGLAGYATKWGLQKKYPNDSLVRKFMVDLPIAAIASFAGESLYKSVIYAFSLYRWLKHWKKRNIHFAPYELQEFFDQEHGLFVGNETEYLLWNTRRVVRVVRSAILCNRTGLEINVEYDYEEDESAV